MFDMKLNLTYILGSLLLLLLSCKLQKQHFEIQNLTVEGREDLIGLQGQQPRLSWKIAPAKGRATVQTAYQILVSSTEIGARNNEADLWNSGKVPSDSSINISFKGKALESYSKVYWKVKVWSAQGDSATSAINQWRMAMLTNEEWKANWIGLDTFSQGDAPRRQQTRLAARYLRKEVSIGKELRQATAFISGMGLYELYINGEKIGNDVLSPTATDYNHEVPYNTYDITEHLFKDRNAIGVILGNGRFFNLRDFKGKPNPVTNIPQINYGFPKMILQIRLEYTDGSISYVHTDQTWKVTDKGPIRANNEYDGEEYDARKELSGWDKPGYNDQNWSQVELVKAPPGKLYAQKNENIRIKETLRPKTIHKTARGSYILDMGQNMVGWLRIKVRGQAGDTVRMVFSERLKNKDTLYVANLRDARATDTYVLKGNGNESWAPRFTYHGFQYVELNGLKYEPSKADFEGQVVYDDVPTIGQFRTSDPTINQIYSNAYWSIRGNYRGIPTDCPQRDERVAWLGDRLMSSYGESFIFDNSRLYSKWMADTKSAQHPNGSLPDIVPAYWINNSDNVTYPSAFIIIPEMLRKQFGDEKTYRNYYPDMKKWLMYMWNTHGKEDLVLKDSYGDWCVAPEEGTNTIWTNDPGRTTDGGLVAASYYYYCLTLMENFARLQGLDADLKQYADLKARVFIAFNKKFFNFQQGHYSNNTTTANLLPLTFGLVPADKKQVVFQKIVERTAAYGNHINSGIMGMMWIMRGLSDHGRPDLAYTLATNRTYPSWGYMAAHGATTIWELWNGNTADPLMNSWNHQMLLGDLLIWYYEYLAGIKSDSQATAFKKIIMNPIFPDSLKFVEASYESKYGTIKSHWTKEKNKFSWNIVVPPNTSALVYLPANDIRGVLESGRALEDQTGLSIKGQAKGRILIEIGSGSYNFVVRPPNTKPTATLYNKKLNDKASHPELLLPVNGYRFTPGGLSVTAAGSLAKLNKYYALAGRLIRYHVRFSEDAVGVFQSDKGDFKALVDIPNRKISIATSPVTEVKASFLTADREYIIEIHRNYQESTIRIMDPKTGQSAETTATNDGTGGCGAGAVAKGFAVGRQYDYYCFGLGSGTSMLINQIEVSAKAHDFNLLIYGDSITEPEGYFPTSDFPQSWTQLIIKNLKGKGMSSGRGGTTITELLERIKNELPFVKSKYVMVTIGTNGGNTEENLGELVEYIQSQGAIPILNNIPSNESGSQVAVNAVIEKVRDKYKIKGCRFDLATAIDQEGRQVDKSTMWFEDYDWGKIYHHPNVKGSLQMYNRTLVDAPEIYK